MAPLRLLVIGGYLSYRALFEWLRPSLFFSVMLVTPVLQMLFFAQLGRYAQVADPSYFVIGNAVVGCTVACVYGPILAMAEERATGTLPALLASPANRIIVFVGRLIPFALNGLLVSAYTLLVGALVLDADIAAGEVAPLALTLMVAAAACSGLGLCLGAVGLLVRDVPFLANLVALLMLLVSGANVALDELPTGLRILGEALPLSRGIEAARRIADGETLSAVSGLLLGEIVVGLVYFVASVGVFAWAETTARTRATLELA
ncbi:ABC transporter permease [Streptomyces sp. NBC_00287]|uniref:ABC transporter permease n=1 Tax=Streptomyces sp. NBC_00287 TaxID=2975702 RepID=UPI002E298121|nr:ABC transporter permease [Streptomyces sp. NBC_00287]